jgi:hypothetical protein
MTCSARRRHSRLWSHLGAGRQSCCMGAFRSPRNARNVLATIIGVSCVGLGVPVAPHPGPARAPRRSLTAAAGCVTDPSAPAPQCLIRAHRLPRSRPPFKLSQPGRAVRGAAVFGDRVFLDATEGVALANGDNAEYPVLSTDGGRVWRIDGPPVHVDAADGAEGVGSVGIAGPRMFFAYGSSVVDVTTTRGATWWQACLGDEVVAVVVHSDEDLVAYVARSVDNTRLNPAVTLQYVSRDGGRRWRYSTQFAGNVH